MKLYYDRKSKDPTYFGQQGYRNGKKVTTKNVINFGKRSQLLQITDDPEAYVREQIQKWNEENRSGKTEIVLSTDFREEVPDGGQGESSSPTWLNVGYFVLQETMKRLQLKKFFEKINHDCRTISDCYTINRFLTYTRILDPQWGNSSFKSRNGYFEQPELEGQSILGFMDLMEEHVPDYLAWLNKKSCRMVERDFSVLYCGCTDFAFGKQSNADSMEQTLPREVAGAWQTGPPALVATVCLVADKRGIPITMSLPSSDDGEKNIALSLEKEAMEMTSASQFIFCSGIGGNSYELRRFNSMDGRAFIVAQSMQDLEENLKKEIFRDDGYRRLSDNAPVSLEKMKRFPCTGEDTREEIACKIIPADHGEDLGLCRDEMLQDGQRGNRRAGIFRQRILVIFSPKLRDIQKATRERQIQCIRKWLEKKETVAKEEDFLQGCRFLKGTVKTSPGEEAIMEYCLDSRQIEEEERYDGYYALATNMEKDAKEILSIYCRRYREETFLMPSESTGYQSLPKCLRAHFLISFTALLVFRLLEARLEDMGLAVPENDLLTTIRRMNVANIHDVEYKALYTGSSALAALVKLTDMPLDHGYYRPGELNSIVKKMLQ